MLRVRVISLFPEMFAALTESGITRRASEHALVEIEVLNPREFSEDKHQSVDDRPYGGGPGMVMRVEPLKKAVEAAQSSLALPREQVLRIYLSPQGRRLDKVGVNHLGSIAETKGLILICGRYEGVDERFLATEVDEEWSIGDYVLSGGELPAMVLLDALIRKLPTALGDEQSAEQDSFENGLLDCPHYTRPEKWSPHEGGSNETLVVPEVLLSGDHKRIADWRLQQSLVRTWLRRPDLIEALKARGEFSPELNEILQAGLQKN